MTAETELSECDICCPACGRQPQIIGADDWYYCDNKQCLLCSTTYLESDWLKADRTVLRELKAARQWRPMESAPRDGTEVLLKITAQIDTYVTKAFWNSENQFWEDDISKFVHKAVTGWQPLPEVE